MRYIRPSRYQSKEYDFCHYIIVKDESISEQEYEQMQSSSEDGKVYIHIRFQRLNEMNVYLYGGKNRSLALEGLIKDNKQV